MYTPKKVPVLLILKLLLVGATTFGLIALFVLPRLELHSSMQKAFERNGKSLIRDHFRSSLKEAKSYLGEPYKIDEIRIDEKVAYWNYDPVTLQLHLHKDRVLRIGYLTSDSSTLSHLNDELRKYFGSDDKWQVEKIQREGKTETTLINPKRRVSLVEFENGVFVYGYILKSANQAVLTTSEAAPPTS